MSRPASVALRRYQRAISLWPHDRLRPNTQLQDVIQKSIDRKFDSKAATPPDEAAELKQANVLLTLLNDSYKKKYPIRKLLVPKSQPTYFADLLEELERAPDKTWFARMWERLAGFIRLTPQTGRR